MYQKSIVMQHSIFLDIWQLNNTHRTHCFVATVNMIMLRPTVLLYMYFIYLIYIKIGDRGSTVVKVLCYKSEGRWFDPS